MTQLDSFIKAFGNASSGVRDMCNCGKVYYKNDEFDEDDEEVLGAFSLDCGVETITFEGKTYVRDCSCWVERAKLIMGFIDTHNHEIASYLNAEKKRMTEEANSLPTVD